MTLLIIHLIQFLSLGDPIIYDFGQNSDLRNWKVVDDSVMGGISQGNFNLNKEGNAVFSGEVSLENNGGFSSVRYNPKRKDVKNYSGLRIRLRGDGKRYQFRVKSDATDYHSYVYNFNTNTKWQTVTIPFNEMYASFRGMTLDTPNYPGEVLSEIAFLIANKKNENFRLEIDNITLE